MSTRYNTGNPIESTDVRDMSDNAKNFDEFSNSTSDSFTDRFGRDMQTIEGSIRKAGFQPASFDFITGGTLVSGDRNKAVFNPEPSGDNNWYAWQGAFPKIISPNSTPETSGGFGESAWKPVTNNVLAPSVGEALRRSYAEAGYNLVDGSFQVGFTLANSNDVALDEAIGKAFSGPAGTYPAGTSVAGFTDESYSIRLPVFYPQIRSYTGSSKELRCVGRQTLLDRGFGDFVRDDSDTSSPDNDGTVLIDALGRRWKRRFIGAADVRWWGVVGDGVTSDSLALAKAISSHDSLVAWSDARILLTKTFDDGSPPSQQFQSYAINPVTSCTIDLAGGAIVRASLGSGDAIDMYKSFIVNTAIKFRIENGVIDMNNHNGRFALFNRALPDSGIYNCIFINTRNNGVPRTTLPESAEIVVIRDCEQVYCDHCKYYVGSNGDKSGNAAPSYDNPSFGVRIATKFVTSEAAQTESTVSCAVRNSEFWGPFSWQPVEIAGTGTRSCYMKTILMYKPILSMIDLDKGCKRCYAEDIEIRFPGPGIVGAPAGGDGFAVVRFQGYRVGGDAVYAEDCWARSINIYGLPYAPTTPSSAMIGQLVSSADAIGCTAYDITVHGYGVIRDIFAAESNSALVLERVSANAARLTRSQSPFATLNDCNLKLTEEGITVSTAYLNSNGVDISINGGIYEYIGSLTPNFFQGFEQAIGQPSIEIFGATTLGWNSFSRATGTTQLTKVRFVGNKSKQRIADAYTTIPATNIAGNVSVLF